MFNKIFIFCFIFLFFVLIGCVNNSVVKSEIVDSNINGNMVQKSSDKNFESKLAECQKVPPILQASCIENVAVEFDNIAICKHFESTLKKEQCEANFAGKKGDLEFCNTLSESSKVLCLEKVAATLKDYSMFANQIQKLLAYQTENGVVAGVEVVSKQGFSQDIILYLTKLKDSGMNISWRVVT